VNLVDIFCTRKKEKCEEERNNFLMLEAKERKKAFNVFLVKVLLPFSLLLPVKLKSVKVFI
jgi:hypothetical protein